MPTCNNETYLDLEVNQTKSINLSDLPDIPEDMSPASMETIVGLSLLFFIIELAGIMGNSLVIFVILSERKMRHSVTNLFILNLAVADLTIMLLGIPDVVQFMLNRGWLLGTALCKTNRFVLVVALYCSVLTLVSVCVERFIAIVYPIKAHLVCSKRRILIAIGCIWPFSIICGLPTVLFNQLQYIPTINTTLCVILIPSSTWSAVFDYSQFTLYYFIPIIIQIVLYTVISRKLFASTDQLQTRFHMRTECKSERSPDAIKARRGVVKMLMASVFIYFLSYAPPQILLFYNTFSESRFQASWSFTVFALTIAYVNSAVNPILYSIFSQNFRRRFHKCLCCICVRLDTIEYERSRVDSYDTGAAKRGLVSRTYVTKL